MSKKQQQQQNNNAASHGRVFEIQKDSQFYETINSKNLVRVHTDHHGSVYQY